MSRAAAVMAICWMWSLGAMAQVVAVEVKSAAVSGYCIADSDLFRADVTAEVEMTNLTSEKLRIRKIGHQSQWVTISRSREAALKAGSNEAVGPDDFGPPRRVRERWVASSPRGSVRDDISMLFFINRVGHHVSGGLDPGTYYIRAELSIMAKRNASLGAKTTDYNIRTAPFPITFTIPDEKGLPTC